MLTSLGKLGSIVEMVPLINAPPPPYPNVSVRTSSLFQFAGIVQDIPCWSHFTVCPFATAAICAAVGVAFSTSSPPVAEVSFDEEDDDESEEPLCLSLLVKLHAATTRMRRKIAGICFIEITNQQKVEEQPLFTLSSAHVSNSSQ